ncbi:TonB-dependent receptor [Marinimicrobium sp. ARAG 43.8]|uniref:TonB-dependent receptor n=1 Tax=Marinimicrobium sp. ARAG 43.8 TaxID=3418719 RepID=UPI003CE8C383
MTMRVNSLAAAVAAATAMTSLAFSVQAQAQPLEEVVVTGIRSSLETSTAIKRESAEIVESVTAEDVGKLPDPNVAETLTRIPGVQGYRYGGEGASPVGEGSGLTIRGLSGQTASRLNGRAYYTAGSREFNIESAIPGMIAGIDVYKTPNASQIEGGIGGLIDIRTRRPFDMDGEVISAAATARYNDFAGSVKPELFGLYSNTWQLDSGGEIGFLLAGNMQESHNRSDSSPGNRGASLRRPVRADDPEYLTLDGADQAYAGQSDVWYLADGSTSDPKSELVTAISQNAHVFQEDIRRERRGVNAAFQWAPNDDFEFFTEGNYNYYEYNQEYRFLTLSDSRTVRDLETQPFVMTEELVDRNANGGPNESVVEQGIRSGTFLNSSLAALGGEEYRPYETWQIASGFDWRITDNLNMTLDLSYTSSEQTQDNRSIQMTPAAGLSWDVTRRLTSVPHDIEIDGPDLSDPNNFVFNNYSNGTNRELIDEGTALQVDFDYAMDGFFNAVKFGARLSTQESEAHDYANSADLTASDVPVTSDLVEMSPTDWVRNDTSYPGGYIVFNTDLLHSGSLSNLFPQAGIPSGSLPEILANQRYAEEETAAAYVVGEFATSSERIRGNVGVRVINTDVETAAQVIDTTGSDSQLVPVNGSNSYTDVLPSLNLTGELREDLLLRFGYHKGMTRPSLSSLAPTVTVDPLSGNGTGGNPNLEPLKADSFDLSLEKYFGPSSYVSAAVFYKDIDGFINGIASCESVPTAPAYSGGVDNSCSGGQYLITREVNAEKGNVQGIELAGQTFFDGLPGIWSNFGVSGSYTHVETENPIERNGEIVDTPQAFQSDDSYSISGVYEDDKLSARLVYTYRSDFILFGVADTPVNGRYVKGYGIVDASINYSLSDRYSISFNASNLTDKAPSRYIGEPGSVTTGSLNQYYANGRNFSLSFRATFGS